jgi:hypothetical protein
LAANGIAFRKIPIAETKTPDYAVTIAGAEIIFGQAELG